MAKSSLNASDLVAPALGVGALLLGYQVAKRFGLVGDTGAPDVPGLPNGVEAEHVDEPPTLTVEVAQSLAATIYAALYGDGTLWSGNATEDEAAVIAALDLLQNDADVLLLIQEYGTRTGGFALTGPLTLPAAVQEYLSPRNIAEINANFARKGIQIRF